MTSMRFPVEIPAQKYGSADLEHEPLTEDYPGSTDVAMTTESKESSVSSSSVAFLIAAIAFFSFAVYSSKPLIAGFSSNSISTKYSQLEDTSIFSAGYNGLSAVVTNEYTPLGYTMLPYPFLTNALLMEPYRDSTVTIKGATPGCTLSWNMVYLKNPDITLSGTDEDGDGVFIAAPKTTGEYTLHVSEQCSGSSSSKSLEQTVWVKYVRRELMSLTDQDREEFLDTFHTMWTTTTKDGMEKYGPNFKSVAYFAQIHNDAGANSICDEFHAGSGFVNNHIFLGMYLEQSMRMINPRVSLHYMEYTKYFSSSDFKKHLENPLDGGAWTELLTSKWFGSNDPYTGYIVDGRWAKVEIPRVDSDFFTREMISSKSTFFPDEGANWMRKTGPHITNPYGLLRAPWNYNPCPHLVRYNNLNALDTTGVEEHVLKPYLGSTCEDLKRFIVEDVNGKTLESFLETTEDMVHGYIHFTFGGAGGEQAAAVDKILKEKYGLTNTHLFYIAESSHKFIKTHLSKIDISYTNPLNCTANPWQNNALKSEAYPGEPGGPRCTCHSSYLESEESLNKLIDLYFNHFMPTDDSLKNVDFETRKEIMQLVCSRFSYEGEMGGSGAAIDPLFWVAHGAIERLFQRVVFADVLADMFYKNQGRGGKCSGHDQDGTKAWLKGYQFQDNTIDPSTLQNTDLLNVLVPTTDSFRDLLDTVYEDSSWGWCPGFDDWLQPATA